MLTRLRVQIPDDACTLDARIRDQLEGLRTLQGEGRDELHALRNSSIYRGYPKCTELDASLSGAYLVDGPVRDNAVYPQCYLEETRESQKRVFLISFARLVDFGLTNYPLSHFRL